MKQIKSLNLMENKKIIFRLNIASVLLVFLFFPLFTALVLKTKDIDIMRLSLNRLFQTLVLALCLIVIHELIHGLFFKWFHPKGKVKFGFKNGLAYATSPGSLYNKWQFAWISIAPFVLITFSLWLALELNNLEPIVFIYLATFHASACVGDFYWIYLIFKAPRKAWVEDTEVGINFYLKED